jgi:hypothetical protein
MIKLLKVKYFKNFIRYQSSTGFDTTVKFIETSINKLRPSEDIDILPAVLDWNYLLNKENLTKIETNNKNRKGLGDIRLVVIWHIFKIFYINKNYLNLSINYMMILKLHLKPKNK